MIALYLEFYYILFINYKNPTLSTQSTLSTLSTITKVYSGDKLKELKKKDGSALPEGKQNAQESTVFYVWTGGSGFTVDCIVSAACVVVISAGDVVKRDSSSLMQLHVKEALIKSSKLMAEKLSARMAAVDGSVQLLVESIQDRIVGYPTLEGWQDGNYVPFMDMISGRPKYPLSMAPAPLDWTISATNTSTDHVSTDTAAFHFQGSFVTLIRDLQTG